MRRRRRASGRVHLPAAALARERNPAMRRACAVLLAFASSATCVAPPTAGRGVTTAAAAPPSAVVALAPLANCSVLKPGRTVCYQGPAATIAAVQAEDPLACKVPEARLVPTCASVGFTAFVGSDPVFKAAGLWREPAQNKTRENMTVCGPLARCTEDCKTYQPPLGACYSPPILWPRDSQWGSSDTFDECNATHLSRSFYASTDGTCATRTDGFDLPLHACVGPFGKPRPWGQFSCT